MESEEQIIAEKKKAETEKKSGNIKLLSKLKSCG